MNEMNWKAMHYITRQIIRLSGLIMIFLISACAGTQDKQAQQPAQSFDMVIYDKAKTAFQAGDYKAAASLFGPVAENGNADAQYSLGYLYYHGKGVTKSLNKAMYWFRLSAKQGNQKAIAALNTIDKLLKQNTQGDTSATSNALPTQTYPAPTEQSIIDLRQATKSGTNKSTAVIQTKPLQPETDIKSAPVTPTTVTEVAQKPLTPVPTQTKLLQPETDIQSAPVTPTIVTEVAQRPLTPVPTQTKLLQPETDIQSAPVTPTAVTEVTQKPLTPEQRQIKPARTPMEIENRKWIMQQPSSYYTIQLASSAKKNYILEYVRKVALDGVYFYGETMNSTTRYYVIHGSFEDYIKARRKLRLLHKRGYKDAWIRDMKGIKRSLQQQ